MREIALDTETTGLDPFSGHRIVEIGCVEMFGKVRTGRYFQRYINPERDMPPEAERIHGITAQSLIGKPVFAQVVEELLEFMGDAPLVIHNAAFDLKFLNFELERLGFKPVHAVRAVDTVTMARRKFPGAPASLDALCRRFSLDLTARSKHGALLDAELLADVYLELCGGRQATIAFEPAETAAAATIFEPGGVSHAAPLAPRFFALAAEEVEAHRRFIAQLKNALWEKFFTEKIE